MIDNQTSEEEYQEENLDEDLLDDEVGEDEDAPEEEEEGPLDPEMELEIEDYIEYVENLLDSKEDAGEFYSDDELTDFRYLGNPEALKKKEEWAEQGCRPLPDEFYEAYYNQMENEKELIVAANKKEFLIELVHELEQTVLIEAFEKQSHYIETMNILMEKWRAEGEMLAKDPDTGEYYYDPPSSDEDTFVPDSYDTEDYQPT